MKRAHRRALAVMSAALTVSFVLAERDARAQDRSGVLDTHHHEFESPQNFVLELRLGPYRPNIDSDPALNGARPYDQVFGDSEHLYLGVEFDWQAYRIPHLGTLGPGFSVAHVGISTQAPFAQPRADGVTASAENTSLEIFPMYVVGVFRADVFMRDYRIPIVPYLKAGMGMAFWRGYNDAGTTTVNNVAAKGHTFGTHIAIGAGLCLNGFDEYTARNFDNAVGVNHTYLYWEYYVSNLTGIGQVDALRVGNSSWMMGLAFEF